MAMHLGLAIKCTIAALLVGLCRERERSLCDPVACLLLRCCSSHTFLCCNHSKLDKPCHVTKVPLTFHLTGVVKAKPAKIKVEVPKNSSYSSYGAYGYDSGYDGETFLPGTSLIAYIPSPPLDGYKESYTEIGPVLLKYVINWYNNEVVLPDGDGTADSINPKTPVEPGKHPKLPMVEPGTYGLFVAKNYPPEEYEYEYGQQPEYEVKRPHYEIKAPDYEGEDLIVKFGGDDKKEKKFDDDDEDEKLILKIGGDKKKKSSSKKEKEYYGDRH